MKIMTILQEIADVDWLFSPENLLSDLSGTALNIQVERLNESVFILRSQLEDPCLPASNRHYAEKIIPLLQHAMGYVDDVLTWHVSSRSRLV